MYNQYSEQSSSDSECDNQPEIPQPRFFKHSGAKINTKKLYINLNNCHYEILSEISEEMDLRITTNKHNWDLLWTDHAIQKQQLFRLLDHQKINYFPGMYVLARKNCLAKGLMRMRKNRAEHYNFFPLTWMLPSEYNELKIYKEQLALNEQEGQKTAYIVKPEASCQGKGIKITLEPQKTTQQCIVQIYISDPFLINGLKFDFRLYVLLAGCDPMRVYLYREGLARFSTETYNYNPTKKNLKKTMVHLTNYAVNKNNPKFVFNKNVNQAHTGHKRSYSAVIKALADMNVDTFTLEQKINQIIVKSIISGQPFLAHEYNLSLPDNYSNDMCFQILGFDILINSAAEPYLLEINHTPSFVTDTPIDHHIKSSLIKDTINLMNITIQAKKQKVKMRQQFTQDREQGKLKKFTLQQKYMMRAQEQAKRDQYENIHLGRYKKIYPTEDKVLMKTYDDLLEVSEGLFRKQIIRSKQKSLPVLKRSYSLMQAAMKKSPSKQLPILKKLNTVQLSPVKGKLPKTSTQLSKEIEKLQEIPEKTNLFLKRSKKSLATFRTIHNSPEKIPMLKSLISMRTFQKTYLTKNPEKIISDELVRSNDRGPKIKQGAFLQPKLIRLDNKPSKEPGKGIHYASPVEDKVPLNYERYILKQTQVKKKQREKDKQKIETSNQQF